MGVTLASRVCLMRDRLNGRLREAKAESLADCVSARLFLRSGSSRIESVFVRSARGEVKASLLICHGIGEIVEHWRPVQRLLAEQGVASLVFDYAGYGRSTGRPRQSACEANALAGYEELCRQVPGVPISLLGFSLGSGVACAVMRRMQLTRLVLCAGFTSFQGAAGRIGVPQWLAPRIWDNEEALRDCRLPVLLMHGDRDALFPVSMAERLQQAAGRDAQLVVWPGLGHEDTYFRPRFDYWKTAARSVSP